MHRVVATLFSAVEIRVAPWFVCPKGSKSQNRHAALLAHGKCRDVIQHTLSNPLLATGNRMIWQPEPFSSCLCSEPGCHAYCGYLGTSRSFVCPSKACGKRMHRDLNGAKNIWTWAILRALELTQREAQTQSPACTLSGVSALMSAPA